MGRSAVLAGVWRLRGFGCGCVKVSDYSHDYGHDKCIRGGSMQNYMASEFKAKCLKIIDEIAESGEGVVVTKRGVPLVKVTPMVDRPKSMYGVDKGKIKILGDVVSPMPPEWYSNPERADEDLF